jgi:hypothetical protein
MRDDSIKSIINASCLFLEKEYPGILKHLNSIEMLYGA